GRGVESLYRGGAGRGGTGLCRGRPVCHNPSIPPHGRRRPMQTVKQATALSLIVLPLTLGLYLTFRPAEPGTQSRPADPPAQPEAADPLLTLTKASRAAYAAGRQETLRHAGPVILVEGDTVVLVRKGDRVEAAYPPPVYHDLKAVAHVPLALYVQTAPYGDG